MASNVLWNSLLVTPTLLGAAVLMSASALAADAPTTDVEALLNETTTIDLGTSEALSATELVPLEVSAAPAASMELATESQVPAKVAIGSEPSMPDLSVSAEVIEANPVADAEPVTQVAQATPGSSVNSVTSTASIDEILQYSNDQNSQSQVTSITQLSDVQPTDWAYQALQSLVERYGCIAGYPDGTYRGQSAMTRYEFAAGLNACLDRISELIAASTADLATREDLATLQRLQEEFAAELATLRGRVDNLEARVAELEENQFSTTTKLRGETIFAVAVPFDEDDSFSASQPIGGYRVRLNFDTSFTGEDLLRARLQARDFQNFDSLTAGGLGWSFGGTSTPSNNLVLDDLLYTFPLGDNIQIILGANSIGDSDFVASTISPFDSSGQGSLTSFGAPAQYSLIPGGFGAGAIIQFNDNLSLDFGYASGEAGDSSNGAGLFNGDYGAIVQLTFLSDFVDAAVMYSNSYANDSFFLDEDRPQVANIYGAQVNFKLGFLQVGGGVAYAPIRVIERGDYDVWSYQATLGIADLGGEGNLLGVIAGAPLYARGFGDGTFNAGLVDSRGADRIPFAVEGFYRFRINENISVTPGVIWLTNPGGDPDLSDTFAGAIRTTFSF
ncbi:iron uptake porin [Thermocoleostomius sinensis]|uniref:Iron uptake porin n=1 Tax=Thermocoleostomius sinensis A174 TaxID=2016057 RepID=A0A9E8ZB32_9CYAN|nr:iron uptake porin [Thermocoleostomius sinensis]WAL58133.1 iron uptake porin [Thermocoleostomius sinensis A174]